ncbi:MAG: AI-2E family transporter [Proteobacteria bacterium]|nr:AI-2E family transporter [Pseudomonadota bacterium]
MDITILEHGETVLSENGNSPRLVGGSMYKWTLAVLILFALYLAYRVFSPFLTPIVLASVLAAIFYPLFTRISRTMGGRDTFAAVVVLLIVFFCLFLPTFFFLTGLVTQAATSISEITTWLRSPGFEELLTKARVEMVLSWLQQKLPFIDFAGIDFQSGLIQFSRNVGQTMIGMGTSILGNAFTVLLQFVIMLFVLFFLLKEGRRMIEYVKYLSPLHEDQEDTIINNLRNVSRSVLVGGLLVALLQGVAGGVGLSFVGIPSLFWGTMMGFTSLVPVLGTGIVWVPATVYLFIVGQWQSAVFLLVWCGLGVTSIDTFLRPYFMKEASGMPLLYIFLSVIGGLQAFGPAGLLYGPLILSFTMVMLRIYGEVFNDALQPGGSVCPGSRPGADGEGTDGGS